MNLDAKADAGGSYHCLRSLALKIQLQSPGGLIKAETVGPVPRVSDPVGLVGGGGKGHRICKWC